MCVCVCSLICNIIYTTTTFIFFYKIQQESVTQCVKSKNWLEPADGLKKKKNSDDRQREGERVCVCVCVCVCS